ncbi:MAG TPA: hypothetical protein DEB31_03880 [Clostridiales bacterium]|nr:hypothetical protein [Clostridiales bacterium]
MKKAPDFASFAGGELAEYIKFMVDNGRSFRVETTILKEFDRFLQTLATDTIDSGTVDSFVYGKPDLSNSQYEKRHRIIRRFLDYQALKGAGESIPPPPKARSQGRRIACLYTHEDIRQLLSLASKLNPADSLRPHSYQAMIGLLYCTGLRISEMLKLNDDDVDLENEVLFIQNTKFKKSRYVPIHPTAAVVLKRYASLRDQYMPNPKSPAFFLNERRNRVVYGTFEATFLSLLREAGIRTEGRNSRTHDLRHSFAVNRLLKWYEENCDYHALLPVLSTYMGHAHFEDTIYYLNASAELMAKGAQRFKFGGGRYA